MTINDDVNLGLEVKHEECAADKQDPNKTIWEIATAVPCAVQRTASTILIFWVRGLSVTVVKKSIVVNVTILTINGYYLNVKHVMRWCVVAAVYSKLSQIVDSSSGTGAQMSTHGKMKRQEVYALSTSEVNFRNVVIINFVFSIT